MCGDITAPFAKVGAILWKDMKTIQKVMLEFEWGQMVSLMTVAGSLAA